MVNSVIHRRGQTSVEYTTVGHENGPMRKEDLKRGPEDFRALYSSEVSCMKFFINELAVGE